MSRFNSTMMAVALSAMATSALAVDVTVNSLQPEVAGSNYQTVTAAITYVASQPEPRLIRITGGGPYGAGENISINVSMTVKGDGVKPVLALPATSGQVHSSLNGNGISISTPPGTDPVTVQLENITVIPALTGGPVASTSKGIRTNNNATGLGTGLLTLKLVDVLVTANNGSNLPITTDGLTSSTVTAPAVGFGDDGVWITGFANLETTGTIVSHIVGAGTNDGIGFFPDVPGYKCFLGPGTVVSNNARMGVQIARDGQEVSAIGTAAAPVVIRGNWINDTKNPAWAHFSGVSTNPNSFLKLEHVVFQENNAYALAALTATVPPITGTKVAFDSNQEAAFVINANRGSNAVNFTNSTFVNNGLRSADHGLAYPQIMSIAEGTLNNSTGAVTFTNSVIAGNGTPANAATGANLIQIATPSSPVSFVNSAIVTSGPYAVGAAKYRLVNSSPAPTETAVISADPQFTGVTSSAVASNYLDVFNSAYDNAGSAGSDLSGYGDYAGTSAVNDWSMY